MEKEWARERECLGLGGEKGRWVEGKWGGEGAGEGEGEGVGDTVQVRVRGRMCCGCG